MTYVPLNALPGVCKVDSAYTNSVKQAFVNGKTAVGRFTDMLNARFIAGMPEKIGGFALNNNNTLTGVCRGMRDFRDYSQHLYCAFGTTSKLLILSNGSLIDATPLKSVVTGSLSSPLTTSGTTTIVIAHTAHGLQTGDYVQLTSSTVFNGVTLSNTYSITVIDANNYSVQYPIAATGSGSGGGGSVSYVYYRIVLSNPFAMTSGSSVVIATHTNHGCSPGDIINISNATAYQGITLSGEYVIQSTTGNTYNIVASNNATGTGSAGGGSPSFIYNIPTGNKDTGAIFGYGIGTYNGSYGYGKSPTTSTGFILNARVWSIANYGQQILASPYNDKIYVWDPTTQSTNARAYPLYGSPTGIQAMFVTAERFIFALGTSTNLLQVNWPDQSVNSNWTASPTNTANSRTLQIGSYLVGGIAVRDGTSLVLTNNCCYAFNYSGNQYVYDSTASGPNSGLIAPLAISVHSSDAYWMGPNEFWSWNGTVSPLPSDDIRDYVFKNINFQQTQKFFSVPNTSKKEVTFYYCSANSIEIDSSVTFHIDQQCWSINKKSRTSQIDALLFQYPISTDANGNIYNVEYGNDANGSAMDSYVVLSPMSLSKGDKNMDICGFMPDFERLSGQAILTVNTQNYPEEIPNPYGPYTLSPNGIAPLNDLRIGCKFIGYKIESNVLGGDYRIGLPEADIYPAGARR